MAYHLKRKKNPMKKHSIISNKKVAKMSDKDIDRLMEFPNIVHNRKS